MTFKRFFAIAAALWLLLSVVAASTQEDTTVQDVLDYIAQHRDSVGIACFPIGSPARGVYLNADERFPLASVSKIPVLAEYARRAADGTLDPTERVAVDDLDPYWLPRTDRNRHQAWLDETPTIDGTYPLSEIVRAMMYYSSNAATDYLIARFGRESFVTLYAQLGLLNTDYPTSFIGLFLVLENHIDGTADIDSLTPAFVEAESERLEQLYTTDSLWRTAERRQRASQVRSFEATAAEQSAFFVQYGAQGTPREMAGLMARIFSGEALSERASAVMRDAMDWAMDAPFNRERFNTLATKGGSFPGILTSAWYAAPRGSLDDPQPRQPTALAIFYRDMPISRWRDWLRSFDQEALEIDALQYGCDVLAQALLEAD